MHPSDIIDPNRCFLDFIRSAVFGGRGLNHAPADKYSLACVTFSSNFRSLLYGRANLGNLCCRVPQTSRPVLVPAFFEWEEKRMARNLKHFTCVPLAK